jgi:hypothetical protein
MADRWAGSSPCNHTFMPTIFEPVQKSERRLFTRSGFIKNNSLLQNIAELRISISADKITGYKFVIVLSF